MSEKRILKFSVAIENNATKALEDIKKQVQSLEKVVSESVSKVNKDLSNIGSQGFKSQELIKNINDLKSSLESIGSLINSKSFGSSKLDNGVSKLSEDLSKLANDARKVGAGGEIDKATQGVDKLKESLNALSKGSENAGAKSSIQNQINSYFKAMKKLEEIQPLIGKLSSLKIEAHSLKLDTNGIDASLNKIREFRRLLNNIRDNGGKSESNLSTNDAIVRYGDALQKAKNDIMLYQKAIESVEKRDSGIAKKAENDKKALEDLRNEIIKINNVFGNLMNAKGRALDVGIKPNASLLNSSDDLLRIISSINKSIDSNSLPNGVKSASDFMRPYRSQIEMAKRIVREQNSDINAALKENKALNIDTKRSEKALNDVKIKIEEIKPLLSKLENAQLFAKSKNIKVAGLDEAYQKILAYQKKLNEIKSTGNEKGVNIGSFLHSSKADIVSANNALLEYNKSIRAYKERKENAAKAASALSKEEERYQKILSNTNQKMGQQSQLLTDLRSMAFQYLSIYGAQNFVTNMAQITGELELQKKSLEVILNNASAAQRMYDEIKGLSQMSPYTFEDLLKSHRQLAAFGIEAKDMFGVLKSLSDIGAGLDVEVSRLILAFGHTRSYGYLSGIQNRQFENAGIDMIGGLVEKYNKQAAEDRAAGREANFVSRKDIFKRMRDRSIPFEDVQDVVLDLDRPGGKFHDMQIRQYDTLGGKLRNLRNNYRIMMSEMGESNKGFLTNSVGFLNELTENWERYARVLEGVAVGYGAMKLAGMAGMSSIASSYKKEFRAGQMAVIQQKQGIMNRQFLKGERGAFKTLWSGGDYSNANLFTGTKSFAKSISQNKELSAIEKTRLALSNKFNASQKQMILTSAGLSKARATEIIQLKGMNLAMFKMKLGMVGLRAGMMSVAASARAMAASLLTNPVMWIFAVVSAVTMLVDKLGETSEQAEKLKNTLKETAKADIDGINQSLKPYEEDGLLINEGFVGKDYGDEKVGVNKYKINTEILNERGVDSVLSELKEHLQEASPLYDRDLFDINKFEEEADQVGAIVGKLNNLKQVKGVMSAKGDEFEHAIEKTGASEWYNPLDWFKGENLITNLSDYSKDYKEFKKSFLDISENEYQNMSAEHRRQVEHYMKEMGMGREEAIRTLFLKDKKISQASIQLLDISGRASGVRDASGDLKSEFKPLTETVYKTFTKDLEGNTELGVALIEETLSKVFSQAEIDDPEVMNNLSDSFWKALKENFESNAKGTDFNKLLGSQYSRLVGAEANKLLDKNLKPSMADEEISKLTDKSIKSAVAIVSKRNKAIYEMFSKLTPKEKALFEQGIKTAIANYAKKMHNLEGWQKAAKFKYNLQIIPNVDNDHMEFVKKQQEKLKKDLEKYVPQQLRFKQKLGIDLNYNVNSKDAVKTIYSHIDKLNKFIGRNWEQLGKVSDPKEREILFRNVSEAKAMRSYLQSQARIIKFLTEEGYGLGSEKSSNSSSEDKANKAKEKAERAKEKAERAAQKADRDWIQKMRSYIQSLNEAYSMYKKWYKDLHNEPAAIQKLKEAFGDKLSKTDYENISSIEGYMNLLKSVMDSVDAYKAKSKEGITEEKKSLITDVGRNINELKHDKFTEDTEKFSSDLEKTLDELKNAFSTFSEVLKSTGNMDIADKLTDSLTGLLYKNNNLESNTALLQDISQVFKEKMSENLIKLTGRDFSKAYVDIGEDRVSVLDYMFDAKSSEEELKKRVGTFFNLVDDNGKFDEDLQKLIPSVVKLLLEWQKLEKEEQNRAVKTYSDAVAKQVDFHSKHRKSTEEYNEQLRVNEKLYKSDKISTEQKQEADKRAATEWAYKNITNTIEYVNFFGKAIYQSKGEIDKFAKELKNIQLERVHRGLISVEDYTKEVEKIQKIVDKWESDSFFGKNNEVTNFISGGIKGLGQYYDNAINNREMEIIDKMQKKGASKEEIDKALKKDGELSDLNKKSKIVKDFQNGLGDVTQMFDITSGVLNGLNEAAKSLSDMFDALGDENKANLFSDISDGIGIVSSIFSPAGDLVKNAMSGNVGGLVSSALSAPFKMITSPIAGIARLHDKRLERNIVKLRESVSKIESYTQIISKSRERTLGYDMGRLFREYAKEHTDKQRVFDTPFGFKINFGEEGNAGMAMVDYYRDIINDKRTGYQQQLDLLKQERDMQIKIYNTEDRKKKKNIQVLEDTKRKIAELDDQIRHFTADLAKELWGVDFKGWASQLTDALSAAFENGTDMAKAYEETVESLMRNVVKQMLRMAVLEPMMKQVQGKIQAAFDPSNPEKSAKDVFAILADTFKPGGSMFKVVTATKEYLDAMEVPLNEVGMSLKQRNRGSSLSNEIKGMSEDMANLLGGYINALRQDVSFIRLMQTQFYNETFPDYVKQMTDMSSAMMRIDSNVAAIRSIISENGALYEQVNRLSSDIHSVIYGNQRLRVQ